MKIEQINKTKTPIVKIDKKLDRFQGKILFPEKLKQANDTLKKVGLPKAYKP
ncbi:hypothetical protein [Parapedobacter tibetensis]|uniref:hypothetical protein n=1 Tax=Parapedobacter tibetensis TaxID=2972951 RepID=UPI00214D4E42|nr:hypothetical protein [Parapedobacter tibetensis]